MAPGRRKREAARSQAKDAGENLRLAEMASGSPQMERAPRPPFVWCPRKALGNNGGDRARAWAWAWAWEWARVKQRAPFFTWAVRLTTATGPRGTYRTEKIGPRRKEAASGPRWMS